MSDTRRKSDPWAYWWAVHYHNARYWVEYSLKTPRRHRTRTELEAKFSRIFRDEKLIIKGADGHNAKGKGHWRFDSAREDGSGKLNTYDETGAGRRNNRAKKRQASKDTRRYGKKIIKDKLDD